MVLYSQEWEENPAQVAAVLWSLRGAGLLAKCKSGEKETTYLGYILGKGQGQPLVGKVQALTMCPCSATKMKVQSFGGPVGYCC